MKKREWLLLGAYIALIVVLSFYHEMFRDEVRALSVATDAPSWVEMLRELHHEGHPALWYIILRAGYWITGSNLILPVASLLIAIAAAWTILRFAPFSPLIKGLSVFGAFLGYELSVSARNYGIGVLLMVLACAAFSNRDRRPLVPALALALLANTSVHGAIASVVLLGVWLLDLLDPDRRHRIVSASGIAAVGLVIVGIVLGLLSARPTGDMVWVSSLESLGPGKILRSVLIDPGKGLMGFRDANIAATGEYPWRLTGIDPAIASRLIVDVALAWLLWNLRKNGRALIAVVIAIMAFEVVFRNIYTGGARHEGLVLFLLFSICWMTAGDGQNESRGGKRWAAGRGLLPLLALQALALPLVAQRVIRYDESASKGFSELIESNAQYRSAILVGEPDYFMEAMPYYVDNRIYMARQRQFADVVYFDKGLRRTQTLPLAELQTIAAELACRYKTPVLVAIGARGFSGEPQGMTPAGYGAAFTWTAEERSRFVGQARKVAEFSRVTSDEAYVVYEVGCT